MDNFLFVQWKKPTDESKFVIDGKVSEYSGTESQCKVMDIFAKVPKNREICKNHGNNNLSPSFRCSHSKIDGSKFYFVEGNFEETDTAGRNLVYIFATTENTPCEVANKLKEYASLLDVTPYKGDLEEIGKQKFKRSFFNLTKIICVITIIILLLLFMLQRA